jgi:holo-ACP synthase
MAATNAPPGWRAPARSTNAGTAPSSIPYAESRDALLVSRDARQAAIDRYRGRGRTLVALSLAVPCATRAAPGAGALFAWAAREVGCAFPGARQLDARVDALGPFALWSTRVWPDAAKARCVALESSQPAARLVDLDVYSPGGEPVDRASLLFAPRPCPCCGEPARECLLVGGHPLPELTARVRELLAGREA